MKEAEDVESQLRGSQVLIVHRIIVGLILGALSGRCEDCEELEGWLHEGGEGAWVRLLVLLFA